MPGSKLDRDGRARGRSHGRGIRPPGGSGAADCGGIADAKADHPLGAAPLTAGQPVTAAVRPEKLVQAEDAGAAALGAGANSCKGLVEEAIYVGDATRYRVGLGADGAVIVKVTNRVGARPAVTGAALALAWSPEDTRLFPRAVA